MHALSWPKRRALSGRRDLGNGVSAPTHWMIDVSPGGLRCWTADGDVLEFTDPAELRRYAFALYAAAIEAGLDAQEAAAKDLAARRAARKARGEELGNLHQPFIDPPEPPMHMEVPA